MSAGDGTVEWVCGRFVSSSSPADLASYFGAAEVTDGPAEPRYNVAPTEDVFVVRSDGGERRVESFHWGLVPMWAEDPKVGNRMINARSETLSRKGAFRPAFERRRCLVPADGFYEWDKVAGQKRAQPYFVHPPPDGELYAFAGLWERWRRRGRHDPDVLCSTTIVTTGANGVMAEIHDRMPVILPASDWDDWLDPANDDLDALAQLLAPAPDELTVLRPVGTGVGNVANQGAHLIDEVQPAGEVTLPGFGSAG